jgi:hypothetical protein
MSLLRPCMRVRGLGIDLHLALITFARGQSLPGSGFLGFQIAVRAAHTSSCTTGCFFFLLFFRMHIRFHSLCHTLTRPFPPHLPCSTTTADGRFDRAWRLLGRLRQSNRLLSVVWLAVGELLVLADRCSRCHRYSPPHQASPLLMKWGCLYHQPGIPAVLHFCVYLGVGSV